MRGSVSREGVSWVTRVSGRETWLEGGVAVVGVRVIGNLGEEAELAVVRSLALCT